VLTRGYLQTGDNKILLRGAIKRWPRLAGLATVVVMISWALFAFDVYQFEEGVPVACPFRLCIQNSIRAELLGRV
jgi:hypothetical protein